MLAQKIVSRQQKKINFLKELRLSKKAREEHNLVLIVGCKLVQELSLLSILPLLILEKGKEALAHKIKSKEILFVSKEELKKITGLVNPEPIAALVLKPKEKDLKSKKRILVLDRINDPGNLGTILRSALALGFEGALLIEGGVDPFNDKALRAAKGATFILPLKTLPLEEVILFLEKNSFTPLIAHLKGKDISHFSSPSRLALILGSESHGPNLLFVEKGIPITIPMNGQMNSLNVAIAAGILMFNLRNTQ